MVLPVAAQNRAAALTPAKAARVLPVAVQPATVRRAAALRIKATGLNKALA